MLRPRPIKQQQDYITKKTLLLQHACLLSKSNFVQKTSKSIWWPVLSLALFLHLLHKNTGVYYISALSYHTAPVGHNSVGSKTKSIRPRPRPRPVWDQSCHKTAVSDPKTDSNLSTFYRVATLQSWSNSLTFPDTSREHFTDYRPSRQ